MTPASHGTRTVILKYFWIISNVDTYRSNFYVIHKSYRSLMTVLFLLRYKETAFKTFTNENNPPPPRLSNRIKMLSPPDIFYSPIRSPPDIFYSPIRFTEMLHHYAYSMTSSVSTPKIHIYQERIQLWNGKGSQYFLRSTNFTNYTTCYMLQERTAPNTHTNTHTTFTFCLNALSSGLYYTSSEWPEYEAFIDVMTCSLVNKYRRFGYTCCLRLHDEELL